MLHPLKKYRVNLDLTIADIAKSLGVSNATISKIERGERQISLNLMPKIIKLTGLSFDELMRGKVNVSRETESK